MSLGLLALTAGVASACPVINTAIFQLPDLVPVDGQPIAGTGSGVSTSFSGEHDHQLGGKRTSQAVFLTHNVSASIAAGPDTVGTFSLSRSLTIVTPAPPTFYVSTDMTQIGANTTDQLQAIQYSDSAGPIFSYGIRE